MNALARGESASLANSELSGLVGHWTFDDGTGADFSGRGNDGNLKGTWKFGPSPNGTRALILNGVDTFLEIPHDSSLDGTGELTLEVWVRPGVDLPNGNDYVLLTKGSAGEGYRIGWHAKGGYFCFSVNSQEVITSNGVGLNAGQWYALRVSYKNGTSVGKITLNQRDITFEVTPRLVRVNAANLIVGGGPVDEGSYFNGSLDELRIYNIIHSPENPLPGSLLIFSRDPGLLIGLLMLLLAMGAIVASYVVSSRGRRGLAILIFSGALVTPLFFNINGVTLFSLGKSLATQYSPGQTLPASFFLVVAMALVWGGYWVGRKVHFRRTPYDLPIALFVLVNGIALVVGWVRSPSFANLLSYFQVVAPLLAFYVAVNFLDRIKTMSRALYGMIGIAAIVAVPLLIQVLFAIRAGYPGWEVQAQVDHLWRFNIYQMYGYFPLALVAVTALALALYLRGSHTRKKAVFLLASVVVLSCLVLFLNSRAAIGMIGGVFLLEFVLLRFPRRAWILLALAAIGALVLFLGPTKDAIIPQWDDLLDIHGPGGVSNRLDNWGESLRIVSADPILGKAYVANLMTPAGVRVIKSHNQYFELAVKSGMISLLLFLILMGISLRRSYLLYRKATYDFSKAVGLGIFSWLITMVLIGNMVQGPFIQTFTALLGWFLIGVVEALFRMEQHGVKIREPR